MCVWNCQCISVANSFPLGFILFVFLTFIVRVILSPMLSMFFVAITYSSIWLPQIVRSTRRGRTSGLTKEYILGTTICRLFGALCGFISFLNWINSNWYCHIDFLACPKNVLEVEPRCTDLKVKSFLFLSCWLISCSLGLFTCTVCFFASLFRDIAGWTWTYLLPSGTSKCLNISLLKLHTYQRLRKYAAVTSYDYHPPLPLPDSELPEKSLGDCAICMDTIMVDPSLRRRSKSSDQRGNWDDKGPSFMKGSSIGVNVTTSRNHYSLAPCSHLFVSLPFPKLTEPTEPLALRHVSTLNVWKRSVPCFLLLITRRSFF